MLKVGRTKYNQDKQVASSTGRRRARLVSVRRISQMTKPRMKIPQVCAHIAREAVLQTWVPKTVAAVMSKLQRNERISRLVKKIMTDKPAMSSAASPA